MKPSKNNDNADVPASETETRAGSHLVDILSVVDETAYSWDIECDSIQWESNAADVLGMSLLENITSGAAFSDFVAPEHLNRRANLIEDVRERYKISGSAPEKGIPYRVQYRLELGTRGEQKSLWLDEHGRWWPAGDGKRERARGVVRVINESYWEEQRLLYRCDQDELTGQLNRIRLTEAIGATINRAERTGEPCALLVAAVNNLGVINDTFGFDVGDEVISATARLLKNKLRGGDSIGRYSSNKFGIILNDCRAGAMRIAAERFIKAVREATVQTTACQLSVSISVGGVILLDHANTVHQALSCALQALDHARQKRHNSFMAYEPSPIRETIRQRNISVADSVISALDEDRMKLVLQPMVNSQTGAHSIYECLLRMEQPDGEIVSAGAFIPVAEQLGLSRLIDLRTLELAVDLLKKHPNVNLSLNVSSLTAYDSDWLLTLHKLTRGRRDYTERLIIEITETAAIHDLDQTVAFVDTLKELGCRVAIDDFGAGYTSFKNLKHLDVDMVKIDGAFVKDVIAEKSDRVFIKAMINLAEEFQMETVAEWVGDAETAELLADAGVTYLQGFHYGMPIDADTFRAA